MPDTTDYTSTLGVENDGEPTSVVPAPGEQRTPEPPTPEPTPQPVVTDDGELDEHGQPKKKGGFQRRIDKLSRRLEEKDEELRYWREFAQSSGRSPSPAQPSAQPSQPAAEPTRDQFDTVDEWIQALFEHRVENHLNKTMDMIQQRQEEVVKQRAAKESEKTFMERLAAGPQKYKDWSDVMEDTESPSTPAMNEAIKKSEFAVDILYYLATHEAEAVRISQMADAVDQMVAIKLLETDFRKSQPQGGVKPTEPAKQPKVSSAPPPITPVSTTTPTSSKNVDQMDGDEYLEYMRQLKKK